MICKTCGERMSGDGFTPERVEALTAHIYFGGLVLFAHWATNIK
jgi:hypothetical protein